MGARGAAPGLSPCPFPGQTPCLICRERSPLHSPSPARGSRAGSAAVQLRSGRDLRPEQQNIMDLYIFFFYPIKRVLGLVDLRQAVTTPDGEENQTAPGSGA